MTEDDLTFSNRVRHVNAVIRRRMESGALQSPGLLDEDESDDPGDDNGEQE